MFFITFYPGANVIKLFNAAMYEDSLYARVFTLSNPFHPSLMFVGEAKSLPIWSNFQFYPSWESSWPYL